MGEINVSHSSQGSLPGVIRYELDLEGRGAFGKMEE